VAAEDHLSSPQFSRDEVMQANAGPDNWIIKERTRANQKFTLEDVPLHSLTPQVSGPGRRPDGSSPPIVVRQRGDNREILDGNHRVKNAQMAGKETISAFVHRPRTHGAPR
jgi:hypothetical protein